LDFLRSWALESDSSSSEAFLSGVGFDADADSIGDAGLGGDSASKFLRFEALGRVLSVEVALRFFELFDCGLSCSGMLSFGVGFFELAAFGSGFFGSGFFDLGSFDLSNLDAGFFTPLVFGVDFWGFVAVVAVFVMVSSRRVCAVLLRVDTIAAASYSDWLKVFAMFCCSAIGVMLQCSRYSAVLAVDQGRRQISSRFWVSPSRADHMTFPSSALQC
jgi:hypothetical protein